MIAISLLEITHAGMQAVVLSAEQLEELPKEQYLGLSLGDEEEQETEQYLGLSLGVLEEVQGAQKINGIYTIELTKIASEEEEEEGIREVKK